MNVYTYTGEDLDRLANQVKEALIAFLGDEGHLKLTQEEFEDFCASHVVVLARSGVFGRLWDKLRGLQEGYIVTVMKTPLRKGSHPDAPVIQLVRDEDSP
ncbi:hypothetical protein LCGC14_0244920 [marine sediment metagenome]|uniref:Uncharacterized protein n=1 Tax=marine sediment metagenome TaxID=412755 RepID=A0A0F9U6Q3_9ZZZZ